MKSARHFIVIISMIIPVFYGCVKEMDFSAQNIEVPVSMTSEVGRPYTILTHFLVKQGYSSSLTRSLFGGGLPDLNAMIEHELKKTPGDAVVNLRIHVSVDFKNYSAEGDIVQFTNSIGVNKGAPAAIDPNTGLPVKNIPPSGFDPETGLPKK